MEEELKKEQVKKHSREENEKVTTFCFPTDDNSPSNVVILVVRNDSNFKLCRQETWSVFVDQKIIVSLL